MTDANHLTAQHLAALLDRHRGGALDTQYGPVRFLDGLVQKAMDEEGLSRPQALEFIAVQGVGWTAGTNGRIAVRVREEDGQRAAQWVDQDGTWCSLGEVLDAIQDGNATPSWYDESWVEVQDEDGDWVQRDVLEERERRAID